MEFTVGRLNCGQVYGAGLPDDMIQRLKTFHGSYQVFTANDCLRPRGMEGNYRPPAEQGHRGNDPINLSGIP